jgi:hypothetical protein
MYGYGKTKRRHGKRRGGLDLSNEQETKFLKDKQAADRKEAMSIGTKARQESPTLEGVGTGKRKFDPSERGHVATEHASLSARAMASGGKRRHHKKTHRRRR